MAPPEVAGGELHRSLHDALHGCEDREGSSMSGLSENSLINPLHHLPTLNIHTLLPCIVTRQLRTLVEFYRNNYVSWRSTEKRSVRIRISYMVPIIWLVVLAAGGDFALNAQVRIAASDN